MEHDNGMKITFWGVRGSHPIASVDSKKYGGNTSCVSIELGENLICIDAGTGAVDFGEYLKKKKKSVFIETLFTHFHWDHIIGIPFFPFVYDKNSTLSVYGLKQEKGLREILSVLFSSPYSPVKMDQIPCQLDFHPISHDEEFVLFGDTTVKSFATDHPNGNLGYRVTHKGKSYVHLSDLEHRLHHKELVAFVKDADILVYDSHFTPEEYESPRFLGWGHSTYEKGALLAKEAGVKQLVIFHHAPFRSDTQVQEIEKAAKAIFKNSIASYDGLILTL